MATTAFTIRDLNPIDSAHAGRTKKGAVQKLEQHLLIFINLIFID
jgi:hypothetical protein